MDRSRLARRKSAPLLAFGVALIALLPAALPAAAVSVTLFSDGSASKTVTIPSGGGTDNSVSVSVPKNSYELAATLAVRGGPDGAGHYPWNPSVFLSSPSNSTQIYGFGGTGYGAMGKQTVLASGAVHSTVVFDGPGSNTTPVILLPYGATVQSAQVTLEGAEVDLGFVGPDTLNAQVGQNNLQIDTAQRGSPYLVDIDADGDLDLFAAGGNFTSFTEPYSGGPRFYRNTGSATAWAFQEQPLVLRRVQMGYGFSPALADLDADGDFDLLTVGGYYNPLVRFYWNNGTSTSPSWQQNNSVFSGLTVDAFSHAAFADLDADGDQDLIIGDETGALTYFRNSGTSTSPAWTSSNLFSGINVNEVAAPTFGDYDQDGDLDMVVGNGTTSWQGFGDGTEVIQYFENTGTASSPTFSLTTKTNGMDVGGVYTGTNLAPFLADMDDDGDLDMVVADYNGEYWMYLGSRSVPRGVSLDVGNNAVTDWTLAGPLSGSTTATGLASAFQGILSFASPNPADAWGNRLTAIRVRVSSDAAGVVNLGGISIVYNYSAASLDFATLLNRVRLGSAADGAGNVQATVPVSASSAGTVTLHTLQINANLPPTVTPPVPLHMYEDTRVDNLIDLTNVFGDDSPTFQTLTFSVTANSAPLQVSVYISSGGRFLGADAVTPPSSDNWHGSLEVTVEARDEFGLTSSAAITIVVDPVNDKPAISGILSPYNISEDVPWQLFPTGVDVDGDPTTWSVIGLPASASFEAATGKISWTPLNGDVGSRTISVYLSDGLETVQVNFVVTVINVNDPPYLLTIPNQTALETIPLVLDLTPYFGDEDDPPYTLVITATSTHTTQGGNVLTILFPKGSGVTLERVRVTLFDPHGAQASGVFVITVIPSGPDLALVGVPDQQVVESVPETVDIAPYLYNVKDWAKVSVTTSSAQATAVGTKVTFAYPEGFAADSEVVKLTAKEGDQTASWSLTVTIVRLGQKILIADLPDLDVAADQEMVLELAPYIHNVKQWSSVAILVDSPYAQVEGTTLRLLFPRAAGIAQQDVTLTVSEGGDTSMDTMTVYVRSIGASFYLDAIPPVNAVEGQPLVLFLSSYVRNADPLSDVEIFVSSSHASVEGLQVAFLYPVGGGVASEQVSVLARFKGQSFQTVISVTVVSLGGEFTLAGVPNIVVYAGTPYTISVSPYLFNVPGGDLDGVVLSTTSPNVSVNEGLQLRFLYPRDATATRETLTITAIAGGSSSSQTITVTIKPLGSRLTLAPVPEVRVVEDEVFTLDLAPYILNAREDVVIIAESPYVTVDGTRLTFSYPGGMTADEVIVTVQAGTQFAQGSVQVLIAERNDRPFSLGAPANYTRAPGTPLTWDLAALFGDEEDVEGLTFTSDNTDVIIDNALKLATFVVPSVGEFTFTFTAVDAADSALTAVSPPVRVVGAAAGGGGNTGASTAPAGDVAFPLVVLLLAIGGALLLRRLGGAVIGARSDGPTLTKRP